jgi:hypothetical protein
MIKLQEEIEIVREYSVIRLLYLQTIPFNNMISESLTTVGFFLSRFWSKYVFIQKGVKPSIWAK